VQPGVYLGRGCNIKAGTTLADLSLSKIFHASLGKTDKPCRLLGISTQLHQAFFDAVERPVEEALRAKIKSLTTIHAKGVLRSGIRR
jgi:hypothetical protein